ncbi:TRAP transporter small permease [Kushneria aurantia]|uniref:TRAP transporter small permease protein n=1 Tax=Kushneria aurantia TaxID=504092 RepID=A0ABV6FYN0_9GAMM|nr:TRAP transporter small permease [Kushneria aurantia]
MTQLNRGLAETCGWLLLVVVLFMVVDLMARGFSRPLYGVSELAMFTMIAVVYLGLSHAEEQDAHIRVEFLTERLSGEPARWLRGFITLVSLVTVGIVSWAVWKSALAALKSGQAIAGPQPIEIYPIKFVMFAALVLYALQLARHLWGLWRGDSAKH